MLCTRQTLPVSSVIMFFLQSPLDFEQHDAQSFAYRKPMIPSVGNKAVVYWPETHDLLVRQSVSKRDLWTKGVAIVLLRQGIDRCLHINNSTIA